MEITEYEPYSSEAMHCPSTGEDIFAPDMEFINDAAEAFMGYWHHEVLDQPTIKDKGLREAWDLFVENNENAEGDYFDWYEALLKFLKEYDNPDWIVYECTFSGIACGPFSFTVWYVVKSDTVFEDREEDLEEDEIE